MFAFCVVVGEVLADFALGGPLVVIFGHFEFGLDGSKTRFHEGVVVAVVGAVHALPEVSAAQEAAVASAGILAAAIGMMKQAGRRLTIANGDPKRSQQEAV